MKPVRPWERAYFAAVGLLAVSVGVCGFFLFSVGTALSIARENERDRARVTSPLLVLLLPAVVFQLYLARRDWRETLG